MRYLAFLVYLLSCLALRASTREVATRLKAFPERSGKAFLLLSGSFR
jgi:hypothetical protein